MTELKVTMEDSEVYTPRTLEAQIMYFNNMYKLPVNPIPGFQSVAAHEKSTDQSLTQRQAVMKRLTSFAKTLSDELIEGDDIHQLVADRESPIRVLVDMTDWYGDLIIYCMSEMVKYGIPIEETLTIIMKSNFSKLGADGKPIYDAYGKVLKGPNYKPPEPELTKMLMAHLDSGEIK